MSFFVVNQSWDYAVSRSIYTICQLCGITPLVWPLVWFSILGHSQREMLGITEVSQGAIQILHRDRESSSLTHGLFGRLLQKENRTRLRIMMWRSFLSAFRIRVELIRLTGCHVFVHTVQGCLVATGYHSKHPEQCPRLNPDHSCHCRILADRPLS